MTEYLEIYRADWYPKIKELSATGPASDTTITAGAKATVSISISIPKHLFPATRPKIALIKAIEGVPDGLALAGLRADAGPDSVTVALDLKNVTTTDVTVAANAITVRTVVIG